MADISLQHIEKVYDTVQKAAQMARRGDGPVLVELKTYRWLGHSKSDKELVYRTRKEEEIWKQKCPIKRFCRYLLTKGFEQQDFEYLDQRALSEVQQAEQFAKAAPVAKLEAIEKLIDMEA